MRVLFDQGTPAPPRQSLPQSEVSTVYEQGWSELTNGELLDAAEREGYEILVTTDSNLRHQQNLAVRRLAVVVLLSTSWPRIQQAIPSVIDAIRSAAPGRCAEVEIP